MVQTEKFEFKRAKWLDELKDFEALEQAALHLLEVEGFELMNYEQSARNWACRLIQAGAPIQLVSRQFGKTIAREPNRLRRCRADVATSLGFLLFEFYNVEGQPLPTSIKQAWRHQLQKPS